MKKYLLIAFLIQLVLVSCDQDDAVYDRGNFVSFTDANRPVITSLDLDGQFTLRVSVALPVNQDVSVDLIIEDGTAVLGVDFDLPTSVVIPAGETQVFVTGQLFEAEAGDDEDADNVISFIVSLGDNNAGLITGIGDLGSRQKTVNIVQVSSCPTPFFRWIGDLSVEDVGFSNTSGTGSLTSGFDCDVLVVDNDLPGIGGSPNTIFQLQFTPGPAGSSLGTVEVAPTFTRNVNNADLGVLEAIYEAFGFYDEESGEITLNYVLRAEQNGEVIGNFYDGTNIIRLAN